MEGPVSRIVERFIRSRSGIADCLRQGLINHRALARLICEAYPAPGKAKRGETAARVAAAQMAIGRLSRRMKSAESNEAKILRELRRSRVLTRSNMMAVILRAPQPLEKIVDLQREILAEDDELTVVHGMRNVTLILGEEYREAVRRHFSRSLRIIPGLVKLQILVGEQSVQMRGFSAFVYAQVAGHGVNLIQELTCSGEYLLLIEAKDLEKTLAALRPE